MNRLGSSALWALFLFVAIASWVLLLTLTSVLMSYIISIMMGCIILSPMWFFYLLLLISCIMYAVTPQAILPLGLTQRVMILSGIAAICYLGTLL